MSAPYTTTSLHLAAFLMAKGHPITVSGPMYQREFQFDSPDAEADASAFYQNAVITARLYSAALNDLKKLVHQPAPTNSNANPETRYARPAGR